MSSRVHIVVQVAVLNKCLLYMAQNNYCGGLCQGASILESLMQVLYLIPRNGWRMWRWYFANMGISSDSISPLHWHLVSNNENVKTYCLLLCFACVMSEMQNYEDPLQKPSPIRFSWSICSKVYMV